MCTCKSGPGGIVICDECASQMVEVLNDLLPEDSHAQKLPAILTPAEYKTMRSAVNGWIDHLQQATDRRQPNE